MARIQTTDVVGLDIGASEIKAALVRGEHLILWGATPTPAGAIVDGVVVDPGRLARALRTLWQELGLDVHAVNFAVPALHERFALMSMVEPAERRKEHIELAVMTMAQGQFEDFPLKDSVLDYRELPTRIVDVGGVDRLQLQLVAAERAPLSGYLSALKKAGLRPVGCEPSALALTRALMLPYSPVAAHLLIEVGAEHVQLITCNGTDVLFADTLAGGGARFTRAIAQATERTTAEAELLKCVVRMDGRALDPDVAAAAPAAAEAMQAPADELIRMITELRRRYTNRPERRPLAGCTLFGGGAQLAGLAEQIGLYLSLERVQQPEIRPSLAAASGRYATALGLSLAREVNLLPTTRSGLRGSTRVHTQKFELRRAQRELRRLKRRRRPNQRLMYALAAAAIIVGGCYYGAGRLRLPAPVSTTTPQPVDVGGPLYAGSVPQAQRAADLAAAAAAPRLADLYAFLAPYRLQALQVTVTGPGIVFSARATDAQTADALAAALVTLPWATAVPASAVTLPDGGINIGGRLTMRTAVTS